MDEIFTATAKCRDGRILTAEGTLQQMANWADNVIRSEDQEIIVDIRKKEAGCDGNKSAV